MKIRCLPLAGPENPYQGLMMAGLARAGHQVGPGRGGRWFALTRTWLGDRPGALHLDWPARYYRRRHPVATAVQALAFWLDLTIFYLIGGRLVWTAHNLREHDSPTPNWDARVQRWIASRAARVRLMGQSQWADAARHWQLDEAAAHAKLRVCPEGGYQDYYPPAPAAAQARERLVAQWPQLASSKGAVTPSPWVIHIGNLRPYKGTDRLIVAFGAVASASARLLIAGPPHDRAFVDRLRDLAAVDPRVLLVPRALADEDLALWHGAADLAALPFTRIDNSGTVVLAMGYGLPVVAPAAGAVGERLAHQGSLLYDPSGATTPPGLAPYQTAKPSLSLALSRALALSDEERRQIGAANRQQIAAHPWEAFGRVFDELGGG